VRSTPYPQGATPVDGGVNFALYSEAAQQVEVCLLDGTGGERRVPLDERDAFVWHGRVEGVEPGQRYGFRVQGPHDPEHGYFCDPSVLLLDPYARAIAGGVSVVVDSRFDWEGVAPPATPADETIVYETHVKGLTKLHPDVPPEQRGTYAGLAHPTVIEHLRALGITAVELMPVQQFVHKQFLLDRGLRNYWGYDTIGFFAPHEEYGAVVDFKRMVQALHAAGLEVILDVVYNHTGEGGSGDATRCFRGIDNRTYYLQQEDEWGRCTPVDYTGTGNTMNIAHPQVLQLIMDSLRYWTSEMGVDGFRFDLASVVGRDVVERDTTDLDTADWVTSFFDQRSSFFDAVAQDPVLARVKLIAEPWDVTGEGYQLGNYPPRWAEWNGRYRDTVRDYWRSEEGVLPDLATRLAGSADFFEDDGRKPAASTNVVTVHDGFTLADLVSYNGKHNEANGEGNRDGANDNRSWNCGVEGPTDDPAVRALRARQQRNFLATLAFSQGTPLLLGGDEIGRTQQGNNNAYCQDNELSWYDWQLDDDRRALLAFAQRVLWLRREHPELRQRRWPSITWLAPDGSAPDWRRRDAHALAALESGFLLCLNAYWEPLQFTLPAGTWRLLVDTGDPAAERTLAGGEQLLLDGRSLALLRGGD
jgi:isoamylase